MPNRQIADGCVSDTRISTVVPGIHQSFGKGPPKLWKTRRKSCSRTVPCPSSPPLCQQKCSGRDLNPHGFRHTPLKRTCLPIPPPEHFGRGGLLSRQDRSCKCSFESVLSSQRFFGAIQWGA